MQLAPFSSLHLGMSRPLSKLPEGEPLREARLNVVRPYFPCPPAAPEPCPADEEPAEDAALAPELAAAGALAETDGAEDTVPE